MYDKNNHDDYGHSYQLVEKFVVLLKLPRFTFGRQNGLRLHTRLPGPPPPHAQYEILPPLLPLPLMLLNLGYP